MKGFRVEILYYKRTEIASHGWKQFKCVIELLHNIFLSDRSAYTGSHSSSRKPILSLEKPNY